MLDQATVRKLRKSLRLFERELDRHNNAHCCSTISLKQCHTLLAIEDKGKCSIGDISEIMNIDKSSASRTIDVMVKSNLVERIIPEDNRRTTSISLTEEGTNLCSSINMSNDLYFSHVFNSFSEKEIEQFATACEKIAKNMIDKSDCC